VLSHSAQQRLLVEKVLARRVMKHADREDGAPQTAPAAAEEYEYLVKVSAAFTAAIVLELFLLWLNVCDRVSVYPHRIEHTACEHLVRTRILALGVRSAQGPLCNAARGKVPSLVPQPGGHP